MKDILKKFLASLALFSLLFGSIGNSFIYANFEDSVNKNGFIKMIKNKEIDKKGIRYLVKKRLDTSDFVYLRTLKGKKSSELKKDKKVKIILNKILGNGINSEDMSYMQTKGYIKNNMTTSYAPTLGNSNNNFGNINSNHFLSPIGNKTFKVNFQDITDKNAGKVIKTWNGKENFPDKFVLENGFSLDINSLELEKLFDRSNELKANVEKFKGVDFGKVNFKDPVLKILPDRVQIVRETEVTFKTTKQLNNIKTKLNIGVSGDSKEKIQSSLDKIKIGRSIKGGKHNKELINKITPNLGKSMDLDAGVIKGLIKDCELDNRKTKNSPRDCSKKQIEADFKNLAKSVVTTETQEFSLLPPNTIIGNKNSIRLNPKNVRLSKKDISSIFKKYGELRKVKISEVKQKPPKRNNTFKKGENIFKNPNYCKIISGIDKNISEKDIENSENIESKKKIKFKECKKLLARKNTPQENIYKQNLLNGFTLGESDSYSWGDSVYLHYIFGKKKIAQVKFGFWYGYGFGIRIPIQAEVKIDKDIVDDYKENGKYNFYTKVNTLDADKDFYKNVGLDRKKIFNGNEFVFELSSGLDIKVRLIGDIIDIDKHIDLISLFARIFKASGKSFFGITGDDLDPIIENNGLTLSKSFTPPFDGSNKINLLNVPVDIPVYEIPSIVELAVRILTEVNLDGRIKAKLNMINSVDCETEKGNVCPASIEGKSQKFSAKAVFNPNNYEEDDLGQFSNFGIELDNFKYIPVLVFDIFLQGVLKVKIPARGWKSFSTPKIKVYSFAFSDENFYLGTHDGTNGKVEAHKGNKVYTNNPDIDLEVPNIKIIGTDDGAIFQLTNNKGGFIKSYYSINGETPDCERYGKQYLGKTKIWETPYDDIIKNKDFNIKIISCSIFGDSTKVISKKINLENRAFDFTFSLPTGDLTEKSEGNIIPKRQDYKDYLKYIYKINSGNPNCTNGSLYDKNFNSEEYARENLKNNLKINIKGLACNKQNKTLNKITEKTYNIHNTYYNPKIITNYSNSKFAVSTKNYDKNNYRTYISFETKGETPVCRNLPKYIAGSLLGKEIVSGDTLTLVANEITFSAHIKAITCIVDENGKLVFSSDIISGIKKVEGKDLYKQKQIKDQINDKIKHQVIDKEKLNIKNNINQDLNKDKINNDSLINPGINPDKNNLNGGTINTNFKNINTGDNFQRNNFEKPIINTNY